MKRIIFTILAALLFGAVTPLNAQFSTLAPVTTPVAAETAVAPVVVPETAVSTDVDTPSLLNRLTPEHLIIVVLVIALIYQSVKTQNLIPVSVVQTVIMELRKAADKTATPLDNAAVDMLEAVAKPITAPTTTPDKPVGFIKTYSGDSMAYVPYYDTYSAGTGISFGVTGNTTHTSGVLFVDKGGDDPHPTPEKP